MSDSETCIHPDKDKHRYAVHDCPYVKLKDNDTDMEGDRYECQKCPFRDKLYYEDMQ